MLYPPFQIPCAIILLGFLVGYSVYKFKLKNFWTLIKNSWIYITCAIICVAAVFGLFVYDHKDVISIEQSTAYPGARVVQSGGYSFTHLFSGSLAPQQLRPGHAANYQDAAASATNQSESSTFIFISTFLILPLLYIFIKEKKNNLKKRYIYVAASLTLAGAVLIAWLFIPGLSLLGSILKLSMVTQNRAIMGLGFLNLLFLVTFIWAYRNSDMKISIKKSIIYSLCVFLFTAVIHLDIHRLMPQFIDSKLALLLAIPVPIIVFLLLRKKFTFALGILAIFTLMGGALVNPLYKGLSVMTSNQLINAVKSSPDDNNYWIAENIYLENIASMAGRHSLSGVYTYPQVSLWKKIDNGADSARYNRYAHVSFNFDKNPLSKIQTGFVDSGPDQLVIKTELCSDFLKQSNVTHVISTALYSKDDQTCILNTRSVKMGDYSYYIYSLQWN
jgi:hypothetical protein